MDNEKAIRAAKLTLGGILEKRRAKTAVERAQGQIAPSKYMPNVPRQVHANGGEVTSGIAAAETVAGMLRDGREKEITNEHLNAADPQHLWKLYETGQTGMDLPMDSVSRMERAKAMGMSHEGYHSSLRDTEKFDPTGKFYGHTGTSGISTTDNPKAANRYLDRYGNFDYKNRPLEKNVIPTLANIGKSDVRSGPYPGPSKMGFPLPEGYVPTHEKLGFDSAQFPDSISAAGGVKHSDAKNAIRSTETVMSDPTKIRSRFARFDPRLAHLSHLSASTGGRIGRANGGYVPTASLPIPRLAVASPLAMNRQPGLLDVLGTLNKVAGSARSISDLVSPEKEKAPHAERVEARSEGLTPEASGAMEALRKGWTGQDFGIVSGYRDPEHNERVGGAKDSQHTHGNAYDVNTTGWSPEDKLALADAAWNAGFRGFGFYDNNMHFDVADPRAWGPSHSRDSIPNWAQGWAQERYGYANGGEVTDLGQAREAKQMQTFHTGMMDDIHQRMMNAMEAHEKAVGQGVFDGYEVGDTLQGSAHPMRITGRYMQKWKPTPTTLRSFERMGTKPTIVEHEGEQYIPMLRYETGKEGMDGFQQGSSYLDGVKAAGYQKMGSLRAVKAAGGAAMFEGMHEDLQNEDGTPKELWHGTPSDGFSEFKDEKLGARDAGFYGRGHYLTPDQGSAEEYADPNQMGEGTVMGPLHAALKNPYLWDASDKGAHSTLRDLQSMGIMKGQAKLEPWDNLQRHHIDPFMREMQKRGHDGVIVRTNDYTGEKPHRVSEVVVFKPSTIKHKDAKSFDPNDPNIYHARGGVAK